MYFINGIPIIEIIQNLNISDKLIYMSDIPKKNYTLSILMVVYEGDKDKFFFESLNSLIANREYFENLILVVNGKINSKKESYIQFFKEFLYINQINLKVNSGISKALNIGLEHINSEWVVRFDSDDICCEDRFLNIHKILNNYGERYDVIGTNIYEFTNSVDKIKHIRRVPQVINHLDYKFIISNPINHVSVFFRRSLIEDFGIPEFYPEIDGFEDYLLWAKLLSNKKKFLNIPINTVFVRIGEDMLKRRGGIRYIRNEIIFRLRLNKYIRFTQVPLNLLVLILRIFFFSLHPKLKGYFYFLFRKNTLLSKNN